MTAIELLQSDFLGRPVRAWLIGLLVCLTSYLAMRLVLKTTTLRIQTLAKRTTTQLDDLFAELLSITKGYFLWGWSAYLGSKVLAPHENVGLFIHRLIILLSILQAASWGKRIISFWIEHSLRRRTQNDAAAASTVGLINTLATAALYCTLLLLVLNNFGVNITALIAGLGVGGIAVALAAQNILSDLFASLTIVLDKPFAVGDAIKVGDLSGTVEHIGLKTTRLKAVTGEQLIFSNAEVLKSRLHNFKRMTDRRVALIFGVAHDTPADTLQAIPGWIRDIVSEFPQARLDRCHLSALTDSSIQFELVYFVKTADYLVHMDLQQEVLMRVIRLFEKEKVGFSAPTRTLYLTKT